MKSQWNLEDSDELCYRCIVEHGMLEDPAWLCIQTAICVHAVQLVETVLISALYNRDIDSFQMVSPSLKHN